MEGQRVGRSYLLVAKGLALAGPGQGPEELQSSSQSHAATGSQAHSLQVRRATACSVLASRDSPEPPTPSAAVMGPQCTAAPVLPRVSRKGAEQWGP